MCSTYQFWHQAENERLQMAVIFLNLVHRWTLLKKTHWTFQQEKKKPTVTPTSPSPESKSERNQYFWLACVFGLVCFHTTYNTAAQKAIKTLAEGTRRADNIRNAATEKGQTNHCKVWAAEIIKITLKPGRSLCYVINHMIQLKMVSVVRLMFICSFCSLG